MKQVITKEQAGTGPILIYAMGQLGWSLVSFGILNMLSFFYLPSENEGKANFEPYIFSGAVLGVFTIIGLIGSSGRVLDAVIDPFIANLSDKTSSKFGKRKLFMAISAIPLAFLSFLIFHPLQQGVSSFNSLILVAAVFFYYIFFAMYVIPYSTLLSELGHTSKAQLKISTSISVTWALGFLIGNSVYAVYPKLENLYGLTSTQAFQTAIGIYATIAMIFMLIPVLFLDENRYAIQGTSHQSFSSSIKDVFSNKDFQYFEIAYMFYWTALTFIGTGIGYYVQNLFHLDKSYGTLFGMISFFSSFLFYPLMGKLDSRYGKKKVLLFAFLFFALTFSVTLLPIPGEIIFYIVSILAAFPLAAFGILPNTIVAEIAKSHELTTGKQQAGMFFGMMAFASKVGGSLGGLVFPSLLLFGKSTENPLGIRLTVFAALLFCLAGYFTFKKYKGSENTTKPTNDNADKNDHVLDSNLF
jgi:glycoside/pentoside/hexuronide:cation symporter, GPH family